VSDELKNLYRDADSLRFYFDDAVPRDLFRGQSKSEAKQGLPVLHPNPGFKRKDGSVRLPDVKVVQREGKQVVLGCRCLAGDYRGVSTFDRKNTKLGGFTWHRLAKGVAIPKALAIMQDSDFTDRANHFTIAPKDDMPLDLFQVWLNDLGQHMQSD